MAKGLGRFVGRSTAKLSCEAGAGLAVARQRSRINAQSILAIGRAVSRADAQVADVIHAFGHALFDVTFGLESETPFVLRGRISAAGGEEFVGAVAVAGVRLDGPDGLTIVEHAVEPGPDGELNVLNFNESGVLDTGMYRLRLTADSFIDTHVPPSRLTQASFRGLFLTGIDDEVTQVPEPSTPTLALVLLISFTLRICPTPARRR